MQQAPASYFQLYDLEQAQFQLGRNGRHLSLPERYLWLNLELYARLVKEHGLEAELQAAYEQTLARYPYLANAQYLSADMPLTSLSERTDLDTGHDVGC
jgi:hypothetical protein